MNTTSDHDFMAQHAEPAKASMNSINYLRDLSKQRVWTGAVAELPAPWQTLFSDIIHEASTGPFAQKDVSKFIDMLKGCPKSHGTKEQANCPAAPAVLKELEDGMYKTPDGNIYKVYHTVHGNNQQVAKQLVVDNPEHMIDDEPIGKAKVHFEYMGKAPLKGISPADRLTVHDAIEFGKLYGTCAICGRTLTNELSIAIGIGPICGGREFGDDFQFLIDQAKLANEEQETIQELDQMSEDEIRARLAAIQEELGEAE